MRLQHIGPFVFLSLSFLNASSLQSVSSSWPAGSSCEGKKFCLCFLFKDKNLIIRLVHVTASGSLDLLPAGYSTGYHGGTAETDHVRVRNSLQGEWSVVILFSLAVNHKYYDSN